MNTRWRNVAVAGAALAAGGALVRLAAQRDGEGRPDSSAAHIEHIATIAREPDEVYAAWRALESLPLVMPNVERVERSGATSDWTVDGPARTKLRWRAETIAEIPGERIEWRSLEAPVNHRGAVSFAPAPGGRGTEVRIEIDAGVPGGAAGRLAAKALQLPPQRLVEIDLRRFKSVLEAGDVALNGNEAVR
jgi:uncharacterized membrane protein